jgi:hypothetical protein
MSCFTYEKPLLTTVRFSFPARRKRLFNLYMSFTIPSLYTFFIFGIQSR